jgi:tripartite-type tricarboxylate transporter receptor subunit TctC
MHARNRNRINATALPARGGCDIIESRFSGVSMRIILRPLVVMLALSGPVWAQSYPSKPIRVVMGFPPGTTVDVLMRPIAQRLTETLGQPLVLDNRPGATGIIAIELVARAPADGYTLLATPGSALTSSPHLHAKMTFDTLRDLKPVVQIGAFSYVLIAHPGVPARDVKQLIALARAKPGVLTFGSTGLGSGFHLAGELFKSMAKVELTHVPYKGGPAAVTDMLGGRIDLMFYSLAVVQPQIRAGMLRAIAVTGLTRDPLLPEVPTVGESGVPKFEIGGWHGLFAPAATPAAIVEQLNAAVSRILITPEIQELWRSQGMGIVSGGPDVFAALVRSDYEKYGQLIRSAGIKPE